MNTVRFFSSVHRITFQFIFSVRSYCRNKFKKFAFLCDALHLICKHINAHTDDDDDGDKDKTEEKIARIRFTVQNPQKEKYAFH